MYNCFELFPSNNVLTVVVRDSYFSCPKIGQNRPPKFGTCHYFHVEFPWHLKWCNLLHQDFRYPKPAALGLQKIAVHLWSFRILIIPLLQTKGVSLKSSWIYEIGTNKSQYDCTLYISSHTNLISMYHMYTTGKVRYETYPMLLIDYTPPFTSTTTYKVIPNCLYNPYGSYLTNNFFLTNIIHYPFIPPLWFSALAAAWTCLMWWSQMEFPYPPRPLGMPLKRFRDS